MRVLLTGGAGYVGSACFRVFRRSGVEAFVYDDLSAGHAAAVEPDRLTVGDLRDGAALAACLQERAISHVVHLAALASVPESLLDPAGYWSVNLEGTRCLLEAMRQTGAHTLVLSSTAAVYAHGLGQPIREDDRTEPQTPYGASKLAAEHLLAGYAAAYGMAGMALRYFNAAGADADGQHGEAHRHETHAIPLLVQSALGQRPAFRLFGTDWPTPDGTCIRDFVSVLDLARAHLLALQRAEAGRLQIFNLGSGQGCSLRALLEAAQDLLGAPVPHLQEPPRPGDPARLVADITRARTELGWEPLHSDLCSILGSAIAWHRRAPQGYALETTR